MKTFKRWLGAFTLWIFGWKREGDRPQPDKFVLIAAPHTSNWDLVFMLAFAYVYDLQISWMGKHTLFKFPYGWFMRLLVGIPIDRRTNNNVVEQMAKVFEQSERLCLAVPPEGTRSRREYWKSGFYYIAKGAGVPIVMSYLDYSRKRGGFGTTLTPGDDLVADMDIMREFYGNVKGKYPENYNRIRLRAEDELEAKE